MASNLPKFQYQPNLFGLMSEQTPTYLDWLKRRNLDDAQDAVPMAQMTGQALPNVAPPAVPPTAQAAQQRQVGQTQPQGLDIADASAKLNKLIDSLHPDDSGVLGLGISKPQAMLFALSALLTRKMPQHQALEAGLKLMELPRLAENAKQQAVLGQIRGLLGLTEVQQKAQELKQGQSVQALTDWLIAKKGINVPGAGGPLGTIAPTTVQPRRSTELLGDASPVQTALGQLGGPALAQALGGTTTTPTTPLTKVEPELEITGFTGGKPDIKFKEPPLTYEQIRRLPYIKSDEDATLVAGMPRQQQHTSLMAFQRQHTEFLKDERAALKPSEAQQERDILARKYFKLPWDKLTDDQRGDVEIKRRTLVPEQAALRKENMPAGSALSNMVRYSPKTQQFEFAAQFLPVDASFKDARGAGFFEVKGPGATQFFEALRNDAPLQRTFKQMVVAAQVAAQNPLQASLGVLSGGRMGGRFGEAGAFYEAERKQFSMVFDKYWGGARGAASPQLAKLVASRLPIVGFGLPYGDSPELAKTKLIAVNNVLDSLREELAARVGGKPTGNIEAKTNSAIMKLLGVTQADFDRLAGLGLTNLPAGTERVK